MAGPTQPRSPRLSWAFGSNGPCEEVLDLLAKEHIDSGVLLADAFSSLAGVEAFAAMSGCSVEATSQLALAWTRANSVADLWAETGVRLSKLAVAPLAAQSLSGGNSDVFTAKTLEDNAMAAVLTRAVAATWRIGASTGLLPELRSELRNPSEIDKMLRLVFLGASGAVNTWRAAVRAVERLERWSLAHGILEAQWSGLQLARFLSDTAHGGYSVPVSVRSGLKLMADALLLKWPLDHPVVLAVCKLAKRSAADKAAASSSSRVLPCLAVEQLQHLEYYGCSSNGPLALRWAALLACLLAHACLRFSDAQRSENIQLGKSSLFGFCWRSKRQRTGFPFAALRAGYSANPWADTLYQFLEKFASFHGSQLDYVMPHFGADLEVPLPRPATYAVTVGFLRRALRSEPLSLTEAAAAEVTLHACRRLLPTLAGQMLMSLESRRVLGHWGPQSSEPMRYDTSRCVSELAYKAQVASKVVSGWRPGEDFELPPAVQVPLVSERGSGSSVQMADQVSTAPLEKGWVANSLPQSRKKLRCLHILASPGVTKCGWKFGSKSHTPKTFFVDKPSGPEFVDCGACSAPSAFFSFLSDAGDMPTGSTVPGGRRRLRRSQPKAVRPASVIPSESSSFASSSSSSDSSSDGTELDEVLF